MNLNTSLKPFADWLSISYPSSKSPHLGLIAHFNTLGIIVSKNIGPDKELYAHTDGGTMCILKKDEYVNISMSGKFLALARSASSYGDFLKVLASSPYNITRLDVAYDIPIAGYLTLSNIKELYPSGKCKLAGRERTMQMVTSKNQRRVETGTVYFQNKKYKGKILLKVYDKAHEVFESTGLEIPPLTRYELTVARGASLKDFDNPSLVFAHFIPQNLLKFDLDGLKLPWKAKDRINYDEHTEFIQTDLERLRFLIENQPSLRDLVSTAKTIHGGLNLLQLHIEKLSLLDADRH